MPTATHESAAGQDTQYSWPVGTRGFGLGVTDQPVTEARAGAEALAGTAAPPVSTIAARMTEIPPVGRLLIAVVLSGEAGPGRARPVP
jgi:hypothetical protein